MGVFEGVFPQWAYLVGYNAVSALLWLAVLARAALACLLADDGPGAVYPAVRTLVLLTQTLAALDILHAAIGLVRAPVPTTLVQFAGRSTVLWAVVEAYPASAGAAAGGPAPPHRCCCCCCCYYAAMVLAWGAADAVRYLYFAARLLGAGGRQYRRLAWLRYSAFYALYPVGVAGEVGVVARAVAAARAQGSEGHAWAYLAAATLYVPAVPTLFNHMRRQRRKVLASGKK